MPYKEKLLPWQEKGTQPELQTHQLHRGETSAQGGGEENALWPFATTPAWGVHCVYIPTDQIQRPLLPIQLLEDPVWRTGLLKKYRFIPDP